MQFKTDGKPIVGIITSKTELLDEILENLIPSFGKADITGKWINFDHTSYYWAFPDFKDGSYFDLFTRMRARFKKQVRSIV